VRLPRTALLRRISGDAAPSVILLEAPTGSGKSWLARRALPPGAVRLRGDLAPLAAAGADRAMLVDDVHLLPDAQVDDLVEIIEDAAPARRVIIAGQLAPSALHDAVHLVDGDVLDATALAVTADEIAEASPAGTILDADIERVIETTDGSVRIVTAVLDQAERDPRADLVTLAARMVRAAAVNAQQQLTASEVSALGLLARAPGLEPALLERMGGPGFVQRCLAAGVPLRRHVTGELDLAMAGVYRGHDLVPDGAMNLADELITRDRPVEAVNLLLDAGLPDRAVRMLTGLSESTAETVDPRALVSLLARLGSAVEREPALLLFRATAERDLGQIEHAAVDIDRAVELSRRAPPTLRHRVEVEAARARLTEGDADAAVSIAERALAELGAGEERTYARAYDLLGQAAAMSDHRADLQRAAECYQVAAAAWDSCGEHARARTTRCDLAMSALVPLGRYDEALSVLAQLLASADVSDAERSWMMVMEGFALCNANRLDAAAARFDRISELGAVQNNPRLVATAAWGHAIIAARRYERAAALQRFMAAENTALGAADDVLGVPFLCDAATVLGALGELEVAEHYLQRVIERRPMFTDQVASTQYVLQARRGIIGDTDAALRSTQPAEWWRVHLVTAAAYAQQHDDAAAARHAGETERELVALGVGDADSLGERLAVEQLRRASPPARLLDAGAAAPRAMTGAPAAPTPAPTPAPAPVRAGPYVTVLGGPMTVHEGAEEHPIPAGNQQRLIGVIVAAGGSASLDQISDAVWPGDPVNASRARLRNVLMRLRRGGGELLVRAGVGVRLAPGVGCDLLDFEREASDATAAARADPDLAGRLAAHALRLVEGSAFVDFEYEDWADNARRRVEQQMISLFDLLSVQAEDSGDLPAAQAYAERALRLDRYSDSRYVRLSELLAMQDRVAAAIAVLDDAAEVARELGGALPTNVRHRRNELVRRTALR